MYKRINWEIKLGDFQGATEMNKDIENIKERLREIRRTELSMSR